MFFILLLLTVGCATTSAVDDDYLTAVDKYNKGRYDEAISQLGLFKSHHPYDRNAITAELLIADAQFALKQYDEALYAYQRFVQLHPHHERIAYVWFQIGKVYWAQAPAAINRDQDKTRQAMEIWRKLITQHPRSEEATKAQALLRAGDKRIASSIAAIAKFYCAQGIYHSCAYRYLQLAATTNDDGLAKSATMKAASALDNLLQTQSANPDDKSNIYFNAYPAPVDLQSYINKLKSKVN
ncbi:MAG: outer membrane protein assembly factor BamD [Pseudomonadota bacterium]|nr:outer membrane protein assembly factor BamD [Pseudomonadota bacterium]